MIDHPRDKYDLAITSIDGSMLAKPTPTLLASLDWNKPMVLVGFLCNDARTAGTVAGVFHWKENKSPAADIDCWDWTS